MSKQAWRVGMGDSALDRRYVPRRRHPDAAELLAWDLVEAARPILDKRTRNSLFVALGAGESSVVIARVLRLVVTRRHGVSPDLLSRIAAWLDGYVGAEDERLLRGLLESVAASTTTSPQRTNEELNAPRR